MYNVHLLPGSFGDSILIEYGHSEPKYILIDGGPYFNFNTLMKALKKAAPKMHTLELLVITHIDIDHIDGIILLLNQTPLPFQIKEVWFNGYEQMKQANDDLMGVIQGEYLSLLITQKNLAHNTSFQHKAVVVNDYNALPIIKLADGMTLTLLGPNIQGLKNMYAKWDEEVKDIGDQAIVAQRLEDDSRYNKPLDDLMGELSIEELQDMHVKGDKSEVNGSSIALLATFDHKTCLFTGDLFSEYLIQGIEAVLKKKGQSKLKIDAWKLAHHGSQKSNLDTLMKLIETKHVLVSTDGKRYHHPDEVCIAKLIANNGPDITFYFNYNTSHNKRWADQSLQSTYQFHAIYPEANDENGIRIAIK